MRTVRASGLTNFADCFRRGSTALLSNEQAVAWSFSDTYLLPTIAAIMGTVIHKAAETSEDAITEDLTRHGGRIRYDDATPDMETAIRQCVRMTRMLHEQRPEWTRAAVLEETLSAEIEGVLLTGHPDRVEYHGDTCSIHDLKTSRWSPGKKHAPQMGGYALLVHATHGSLPVVGYIHHLPRTPLTKPQQQMITLPMDLRACARGALHILRRIAEMPEDINPNDLPYNSGSNLCNENWCPAYGTAYCEETVDAGLPPYQPTN